MKEWHGKGLERRRSHAVLSSSFYSYSSSGALFTPFPLGARGYFSPSFFTGARKKIGGEKEEELPLQHAGWGGEKRKREMLGDDNYFSFFSPSRLSGDGGGPSHDGGIGGVRAEMTRLVSHGVREEEERKSGDGEGGRGKWGGRREPTFLGRRRKTPSVHCKTGPPYEYTSLCRLGREMSRKECVIRQKRNCGDKKPYLSQSLFSPFFLPPVCLIVCPCSIFAQKRNPRPLSTLLSFLRPSSLFVTGGLQQQRR